MRGGRRVPAAASGRAASRPPPAPPPRRPPLLGGGGETRTRALATTASHISVARDSGSSPRLRPHPARRRPYSLRAKVARPANYQQFVDDEIELYAQARIVPAFAADYDSRDDWPVYEMDMAVGQVFTKVERLIKLKCDTLYTVTGRWCTGDLGDT